jgi:NRPS condensation-like uncharacterized protein
MASSRPLKFKASVEDWFFVAIASGHDRTIRLALEMDGTVDQPRLARALRLVYEAEPILECRFAPGLFGAYWRVRNDQSGVDPCLIVPTTNVKQDLDAFMAVPVDPSTDPLVQVRVFRGERDTVCIKGSHSIMDGGGFKLLMLRLASLYRALGADPTYALPPDLVTDRGQGQVLRHIPIRGRARAFFTQPFHKKRWAFPWSSMECTDVTFSERTADTPIPALKTAARGRGASITDAIVAALVRAFFEASDAPAGVPLPFTLAVDLRRYLPASEEAGLVNLSSLTWIELARKPGAKLEETLADVHLALEAAMGDLPGVGLAMVMEVTSILGFRLFRFFNGIRIRMAQRQKREFPSLTNIGVMDPKAMDFGDVGVSRARFYSPVFFPPTFCIVSGSHKDRLYFTAAYPRGAVPGDLVERFLDRMVSEIDSLR